jgi:hypothetical protein
MTMVAFTLMVQMELVCPLVEGDNVKFLYARSSRPGRNAEGTLGLLGETGQEGHWVQRY